MQASKRRTVALGDLIAAAFDEAAGLTVDAKRHARLATQAIAMVLCETGNVRTARRLSRVHA
jgi:hypothetical protein